MTEQLALPEATEPTVLSEPTALPELTGLLKLTVQSAWIVPGLCAVNGRLVIATPDQPGVTVQATIAKHDLLAVIVPTGRPEQNVRAVTPEPVAKIRNTNASSVVPLVTSTIAALNVLSRANASAVTVRTVTACAVTACAVTVPTVAALALTGKIVPEETEPVPIALSLIDSSQIVHDSSVHAMSAMSSASLRKRT